MGKAILLLGAVAVAAASAPALAQSYVPSSTLGYEQAHSSSSESFEFQSSQSTVFQSGSHDDRTVAHPPVRLRLRHTTDDAGYLTWAGKTDEVGSHEGPVRRARSPRTLTINEDDFAYDGSVGPAFIGGYDAGGGSVAAFAAGSAASSASASARASASASVSVSIQAHARHGGGHGKSGCGCKR